MKRFILILVVGVLMSSCSSDTVKISGRLLGLNSKVVYVERVSGGVPNLIDSVSLEATGDYQFVVKGVSKTPTHYNLVYNGERIPLLLKGGERVTVNTVGSPLRSYTVDGSDESELLREFNKFYIEGTGRMAQILENYSGAELSADAKKAMMQEYTQEYRSVKLNVVLDPLFMFVLLPDGMEVTGAAIATMLSNWIVLGYFIRTYYRVRHNCVLSFPSRPERVQRASLAALFSVGIPASCSILLFDVNNMLINRLCASYGDFQLAAMGIVLKVERLPLNIGVGICLGMVPLAAYNYAAKNRERMKGFFTTARIAGIAVAACSVVLYWVCAPWLIRFFIRDAATMEYGIRFLRARCFATPFMFLSFHMVHFMQAIGKGRVSLWLAVIRQLCLNMPIVLLLNWIFGMDGIVWTQMIADCINVGISYILYHRVMKTL